MTKKLFSTELLDQHWHQHRLSYCQARRAHALRRMMFLRRVLHRLEQLRCRKVQQKGEADA